MQKPSRSRRLLKWTFTCVTIALALLYLLTGWWELDYLPENNWDGPLVSIQGGMFFYEDWEAPAHTRNPYGQHRIPNAGYSIQPTRWRMRGVDFPDFHPPFPVTPGLWFDNRTSFTQHLEIPLWPLPVFFGIVATALWIAERSRRVGDMTEAASTDTWPNRGRTLT